MCCPPPTRLAICCSGRRCWCFAFVQNPLACSLIGWVRPRNCLPSRTWDQTPVSRRHEPGDSAPWRFRCVNSAMQALIVFAALTICISVLRSDDCHSAIPPARLSPSPQPSCLVCVGSYEPAGENLRAAPSCPSCCLCSLKRQRASPRHQAVDQQQRIAQIADAIAGRTAQRRPADRRTEGSRYYAKREIVRRDEPGSDQWDLLAPHQRQAGGGTCSMRSRSLFREKFVQSRRCLTGRPHRPATRTGPTPRLSDRRRFAAGETVTTERIR